MNIKTKVINEILEIEGKDFTDDPYDSGGQTKWGITEAVARKYGYTGNMPELSRNLAFQIYEIVFWNRLRLNEIAEIDHMLAAEIADTAVNQGRANAGLFLQQSLNVLNNREKLYQDISEDGLIGAKTLYALKKYHLYRGEEGISVLINMLNCLQGAFYVRLSQRRVKDEKFIYGWFKNRVTIT